MPELRLYLATEVTPLWEATEVTLAKVGLPPQPTLDILYLYDIMSFKCTTCRKRRPSRRLARRRLEKCPVSARPSLSKAELDKRRKGWKPRRTDYQSGALWRYAQTVSEAEKGAVCHPGGKAEVRAFADI